MAWEDNEEQERLNQELEQKILQHQYNKKQNKKVFIIILILVLACSALFISNYRKYEYESTYTKIERNMATDEIQAGYENVYVDVVEIDPIYEIIRIDFILHDDDREGIICKCYTETGKLVWVCTGVDYWIYEKDPSSPDLKLVSTFFTQDKGTPVSYRGVQAYKRLNKPLRLEGQIQTFGSLVSEMPEGRKSMEDELVLVVK